jgi:hypothetical protein
LEQLRDALMGRQPPDSALAKLAALLAERIERRRPRPALSSSRGVALAVARRPRIGFVAPLST